MPANDAVVLEQVPAASALRRLEPLRARVKAQSRDAEAAARLAEGYLQIGRRTADPRFISYAQSVLAPWLDPTTSSPSTPKMLVLGATALQNLHRFDPALSLLNQALAQDPQNSQALLTKATLLQVQGRFDPARQTCRALIQTAGQLIAITCLTSVNSLTGHLAESYNALHAVYVDDARLPMELRTWVLGQLAEMAVRLGDVPGAREHFQAALQIDNADPYILASYADLLLRERRAAEAITLLAPYEAQDNLLLRLAIAGTQINNARGKRWSALFQQRFEAARRDGDFTHLREQARYFLDAEPNPARALQLARDNWRVQREPDDVRVYLRAARANRSSTDEQAVRAWIAQSGYEDATLTAATTKVAGLASGGRLPR